MISWARKDAALQKVTIARYKKQVAFPALNAKHDIEFQQACNKQLQGSCLC